MKQTCSETSVKQQKNGRLDMLGKLGIPRLLLLNVPGVFPASYGDSRIVSDNGLSAEAPVPPQGLKEATIKDTTRLLSL